MKLILISVLVFVFLGSLVYGACGDASTTILNMTFDSRDGTYNNTVAQDVSECENNGSLNRNFMQMIDGRQARIEVQKIFAGA